MAFSLPNFNLLVSFWIPGHTPHDDPPDEVDIPCQIYISNKGFLDIVAGDPDSFRPPIFLRVPFDNEFTQQGTIAAVQPGLGDCYKVRWCQNTHKGFPNEYTVLLCEQCSTDGSTPR
jgi:hypothetical protein